MLQLICRILLGLVFTFSGFVKAVDPHGTEYKIQDYIQAFGMSSYITNSVPLFASLLLSIIEFLLGVLLFFNFLPRFSRIFTFSFCLLFTSLTLWLALTDPISDCGCFGDAIVLSNWQTFWKNVILLICSIILLVSRSSQLSFPTSISHSVTPNKSIKINYLFCLFSFLLVVFVQAYSLTHLPILDFRPYKIGSDIRLGMQIPPDADRPIYTTELLFERDGVRKTFTLDNYPDSTWQYISSEVRLIKQGYVPPIHDFVIISASSREDLTDHILSLDHVYLVFSQDVNKAVTSCASPINSLYEQCQRDHIPFYFITASTEAAFSAWQFATQAIYPYCQMDATTIKTIIRANPGIVELRKGIVTNKWNAKDFNL